MHHQLPDRRQFLRCSTVGAAALGVQANVPACFLEAAESVVTDGQERTLVVVQLSGGNDGLNTVVPYANPAYRSARPNLAIAKSDVLSIDDDFGLHSALRGPMDLLENGQLAVVHGVGYENPNRSHFESMDIWHTCVRKDQKRSNGWLGRFLENASSVDGGDVPALHLGDQQQPLALRSDHVRVPTVKELDEFQLHGSDSAALRQLLAGNFDSTSAGSNDSNELLGFLRASTQSAVLASQRVTEAAEAYRTSIDYPQSRLGQQMRVVAQLIDAGMKTRIYYLQVDGFDTHAQQPDTHAILLREWGDAVSAFVKDMTSHGRQDNVCVLTFSEFGRRVAENASDGTDHGAAGPVFLCGGGLNSGLIGKHPSLTNLQQGDLKHVVDFRQVYASVLKDWMNTDPKTCLGGQYETLPIFA